MAVTAPYLLLRQQRLVEVLVVITVMAWVHQVVLVVAPVDQQPFR
jgi:hypothetical protein